MAAPRVPWPPAGDDDGDYYDDDVDYMTDDEDGGLGRRAGPTTWQEVDRGELAASALALISSIAQTAPTDDKSRDAVWHPTTTVTVTQELVDPLGMGRIDPVAMRLEHRVAREAAPQSRTTAAGVSVDTGSGQARGAVGRFFTEFTARGGKGGPGASFTVGRGASMTSFSAGRGSMGISFTGGRGGLPASFTSARGGSGTSFTAGRNLDGSPPARRRMSSMAGKAASLPASVLLPTSEAFDPEAYLAVFHDSSTAAELAAGLASLERELGERQGQLKTLVKQNFDRFISCKTTIDDIYVKLGRIEGAGTGISTQVLASAVQEVQASARVAFGPLLERHSKAERIKSALLRRFQSLFSMPSRIRALAAAHDYEQVCAEYKKANALIRPGSSNTAEVWARLHDEIEKRVSDVWQQLEGEVAQPDLPAAAAPDLLLHMLALQAESLPLAQGKDPVGLLLEARERRARTEMATAQEQHTRAMARLRERYCQAAAEEGGKLDPSRVTEQQLLAWTEASDGAADAGGAELEPGGSPTAAALFAASPSFGATAGLGQVPPSLLMARSSRGGSGGGAPLAVGFGGSGSHLAKLSGLQPLPLQSRLVGRTTETFGEQLLLNHVAALSTALLSSLPGFWAVASSPRLADATDLPPALRARLAHSVQAVAATAQKLVESYCRDVQRVAGALAAIGPLRAATAALIQSLAGVVRSLRELRAPATAVKAVQGVLRFALEAAVQQLAGHLEGLPAALTAREAWVVSPNQGPSDAPITQMPEQLQARAGAASDGGPGGRALEEVTVAVAYFRALTTACAPALDGEVPAGITTRPLHVAFFACLGQCTACLAALAERYSPNVGGGGAAAAAAAAARTGVEGGEESPSAGGGGGSPGSSPRRRGWLRGGSYDSDADDDPSAPGGPGSRGGVGVGGVPGVSDDVRLLLTASNLGYIRSRLMGSLTQRFLLVLTGEMASEVERVGRTVKGLVKRMDAALQVMYGAYRDRKRQQLDRFMAAYVRPDGAPAGRPPELRDITPGVAGLLQALAQAQAEATTYARPHTGYLVPPLLEHVASGLAARYAALQPGSLPPEGLAQYYLDLAWLDGVVGASGPPSVRVDIDAGYMLLAQRIADGAAGAALTPLGRSLAVVQDPGELGKRRATGWAGEVTCRKLLPDILARSTFTLRSFSDV